MYMYMCMYSCTCMVQFKKCCQCAVVQGDPQRYFSILTSTTAQGYLPEVHTNGQYSVVYAYPCYCNWLPGWC